MTRLRPRFNRRMFRAPDEYKGKFLTARRGDLREGFREWMRGAEEEDPLAFALALDLEPDIDDDVTNAYQTEMSRLPAGLRGRVEEMQSRIVKSARNLDSAVRRLPSTRTEARRYSPRGRRR